MSRYIEARDLKAGDIVDVPDELVAGTDNETIANYEFACVSQVGGGWADDLASEGQVVIYTDNFAVPIFCDAGHPFATEERL